MSDWPAELLVWQADEPGPAGRRARSRWPMRSMPARGRALRPVAHADPGTGRSPDEDGRIRRRRPWRSWPPRTTTCAKSSSWPRTAIAEGRPSLDDPRGIVFEAKPAWAGEPVAFVFPGQGAQSPGMLRELAVIFPEVRAAFEEFDRALLPGGGRALGPLDIPASGILR